MERVPVLPRCKAVPPEPVSPDPVPDELRQTVRAALDAPSERILPLTLRDGRRFWLKRVEKMGLVLRLQKGDPERQFRTEREGLRAMAEEGMPVPEVAMEGPGFMVLADRGPSLVSLVGRDGFSEAERLAGFRGAGKALALLHWAGLAHGRPAVRDICWDGRQASFIDLENFSRKRRGGFWQARDILVFVHSAEVQWPGDDRWVGAALAAYAAQAPEGALDRAARLARQLAPLGWLARAALWLRPQSRNLRAILLTLGRMRRAG